ncbi:hypothetical protein Salat_0620400 [Sesamum alatum]|uniref:Reverse transcriptase zinc-binding domain-containing protein n=1 Tax=Sesamum alatum TaxID=300844 RepID=A0AAE1YQK4_9LAMI|nr:hypothetical protein Salat_0620400 [Sesamum alatum]
MQLYPRFRVTNLEAIQSDHGPLLCNLEYSPICHNTNLQRPQWFEEMWFRSAECEQIISKYWNSFSYGNDRGDLGTTIEECRMGLLEWSKKTFGNIEKKIRKLKKALTALRKGRITKETKQEEAKIRYEPEELVRSGTRWRIGDGDGAQVRIWQDGWLPREFSFKVLSYPNLLSEEAKVRELIAPSGQEWNEDLIRRIFSQEEVALILSIPLGRSICYQLMWHRSKRGIFSVHSSYNLHRCLKIRTVASTSLTGAGENWNFLWKHDLPPKLKLFIWKACNNALPTVINLTKRRCLEEGRCPDVALRRRIPNTHCCPTTLQGFHGL